MDTNVIEAQHGYYVKIFDTNKKHLNELSNTQIAELIKYYKSLIILLTVGGSYFAACRDYAGVDLELLKALQKKRKAN